MKNAPPEQIKEIVLAAHGDFPQLKRLLAVAPHLYNAPHQWRENDFETPIQAAAHTGQTAMIRYLLSLGAPLDIPTAATLGDLATLQKILAADPQKIHDVGAHQISLLAHAAWNGDVAVTEYLWQQGARTGITNALMTATHQEHLALIKWYLHNTEPDFTYQNMRGQTVADLAQATGNKTIIELLTSPD
ncbi:MAG TPA: ankyrin repeat domain-containing protein [Anaerolineae bacterium]|nr:ankyrin repeat domain-containing protein [Anaerolineae bacterium]